MSEGGSGANVGSAVGGAIGTAIMPGIGTVVGSALGGIVGGMFGNKAPKKIPYKPVVLADEQKKAIGANLASSADAQKLAGQTNTFNQQEASRLMEMAMPGFGRMRERMTDQFNADLDNPYAVPAEVEQQLARVAAERGISTGLRNSQANQFTFLRDFGLSSMEMGAQRLGRAGTIMNMLVQTAPRVNIMSPAAMFISPMEQAGITQDNNVRAQGIDQGHENAKTAASNARWQAMMDGGLSSAIGQGGGMIGSGIGGMFGGGRV